MHLYSISIQVNSSACLSKSKNNPFFFIPRVLNYAASSVLWPIQFSASVRWICHSHLITHAPCKGVLSAHLNPLVLVNVVDGCVFTKQVIELFLESKCNEQSKSKACEGGNE